MCDGKHATMLDKGQGQRDHRGLVDGSHEWFQYHGKSPGGPKQFKDIVGWTPFGIDDWSSDKSDQGEDKPDEYGHFKPTHDFYYEIIDLS